MLLSESPPTPDLLSRLPVVGPVSRAVGQETNLIFYLMVTGKRPFKGDTVSTICYHIVHSAPEPIPSASSRQATPASVRK